MEFRATTAGFRMSRAGHHRLIRIKKCIPCVWGIAVPTPRIAVATYASPRLVANISVAIPVSKW